MGAEEASCESRLFTMKLSGKKTVSGQVLWKVVRHRRSNTSLAKWNLSGSDTEE